MILKSSVIGTGGKIAESVSLGWDSNRDPGGYGAKLIIINNNDNTSGARTTADDSGKLDEASLCHMFRCKSKRRQFEEKLAHPLIRSYNCIVSPGTTYINGHMHSVIYLITCDKCKL